MCISIPPLCQNVEPNGWNSFWSPLSLLFTCAIPLCQNVKRANANANLAADSEVRARNFGRLGRAVARKRDAVENAVVDAIVSCDAAQSIDFVDQWTLAANITDIRHVRAEETLETIAMVLSG